MLTIVGKKEHVCQRCIFNWKHSKLKWNTVAKITWQALISSIPSGEWMSPFCFSSDPWALWVTSILLKTPSPVWSYLWVEEKSSEIYSSFPKISLLAIISLIWQRVKEILYLFLTNFSVSKNKNWVTLKKVGQFSNRCFPVL